MEATMPSYIPTPRRAQTQNSFTPAFVFRTNSFTIEADREIAPLVIGGLTLIAVAYILSR